MCGIYLNSRPEENWAALEKNREVIIMFSKSHCSMIAPPVLDYPMVSKKTGKITFYIISAARFNFIAKPGITGQKYIFL